MLKTKVYKILIYHILAGVVPLSLPARSRFGRRRAKATLATAREGRRDDLDLPPTKKQIGDTKYNQR